MPNFNNKIVLVTGGASGIGFAIAKRFIEEGACVIIVDQHQEHGEEAVNQLKSLGEISFIQTDVTNSAQVKHLLETIQEKYQRLDCACVYC